VLKAELTPFLEETEFDLASLYLGIGRQKPPSPFILAVRLPKDTGRKDHWRSSLAEAAERAMTHWIKAVPNMGNQAYDIYEATAHFPDPIWPTLTFTELLGIALKDRFIDSIDHSVLKELRGAL
jgi:hypothetical protein